MFRLYSNESFPLPVVEELRRLGCDVVTVKDSGRAGQSWSDEEVLRYAAAEGRILLTLNRKDFFRIHRVNCNHSGIVACQVDVDFVGQARRIHAVLSEAGEVSGQLVRVNRPPMQKSGD